MNRKEFQGIIDQTFQSIQKLSGSKGVEYTGHEGEANIHANFDRLSADLQLDPETVLMVYLTKHLDSIRTYVNNIGAPASPKLSEPIEGRIDDAILYLILLKGMVYRRTTSALPKAGEYRLFDPADHQPELERAGREFR